MLRLIQALRDVHQGDPDPEDGSGAIHSALTRLSRISRPGSLVFLISDFLDLDGAAEATLARLSCHSDVVTVLVYDPLEAQAPPPGRYRISDGRLRATLDTTSASVRRAYAGQFQRRRALLDEQRDRHGIHVVVLATDQPVADTLRRGLQVHLRRGAGERP